MIRAAILTLAAVLMCLPAEQTTWAQPTPRLILLLASDQTAYALGAPVTFTVAVDNSGEPASVTFPSSQLYDIRVLSGDAEVWRWSGDRFFASVLVDRTFPNGLSLLGRETWDWRDSAGAPLPPGAYRAVGALTGQTPTAGNPIEIVLQAP